MQSRGNRVRARVGQPAMAWPGRWLCTNPGRTGLGLGLGFQLHISEAKKKERMRQKKSNQNRSLLNMNMPFASGTLLHVLRLGREFSVKEMLCFEEALLRADKRNWCVISEGPIQPTVVLGLSGKLHDLVYVDAARNAGAKAVRRFTGGGTVVADRGTVFISLCLSRFSALGAPQYPKEIMAWSEKLYAPVFASLLGLGSASDTSSEFRLCENDYCMGDVKFGGNAQAVSRDRWLHHTSFLWDINAAHMALLKIPPKRPAYRRDRGHGEFLTGLSAHVPHAAAGPEELGRSLLCHLSRIPGLTLVNATVDDALEALARNERKSNEDVELV